MAKRNTTIEKASTVDQNKPTEAHNTSITIDTKTDAEGFEKGSSKLYRANADLIDSVDAIGKSLNAIHHTADTFKGTYRTSTALNVREEAKGDARVIGVLNIGTSVSCDGHYALDNGIRYLHITADLDGVTLIGYCQVRYLIKQYEEVRL